MKVALNTLPRNGEVLELDGLAYLNGLDLTWEAVKCTVALTANRRGKSYDFRGTVHITGRFTCEIGLETFTREHSGEFAFAAGPKSRKLKKDLDDDLMIIPSGENNIDIGAYVFDAVMVAIPMVIKCGETCDTGEALQKNLNVPPEADSPWADLKKLRDKMSE
jgi:uncharacterized metal-binding protein YceD (DUF177 family)